MRTEGKGPETVSRRDRPGLYASGYSRLVHAAFDSEMKLRRPQKGLSVSTEFVLLIAHRVVAAFEPVFTLSRRK
jgi:hypothetical protein